MMMETAGIYVNAGGGLAIVPGTTETPHSKDFLENPRNSNDADWAFDLGFGVDGAVGYDFGIFRADLEFAYLTSKFVFDVDPDDGRGDNVEADDSLTVMAGMANAWYDLDTGSAWTPYIGIGVGATNLSVQLAENSDDDPVFDGSGWGFAYQAGVGVAFEVLDGFSLVAGYRFFGTLETDVTDPGEDNDDDDDNIVSPMLMAHGIELGLQFLF
jgi:opacity protein-like surface antigen